MKVIGILMGATLCAALTVNADPLLYWMVDGESNPNNIKFEVAALKYVDSDTGSEGYVPLASGSTYVLASGADPANETLGTTTSASWADIGAYASNQYSFFIELLNWDDSLNEYRVVMGLSNPVSYSSVASSVALNKISAIPSMVAVFHPTVNVPEPTSGLLILIGGSLLALRRRRKVA